MGGCPTAFVGGIGPQGKNLGHRFARHDPTVVPGLTLSREVRPVAEGALDGDVLVLCVKPVAFDEQGPRGRVVDAAEGSAAESAQRIAPAPSRSAPSTTSPR